MYKYLVTGLYYVLFLLLPGITGCIVVGGGGMFHHPPEKIICDKPWVITAIFVVTPRDPKEKYGKLTERWTVAVNIRNSSIGNFTAVPMVIESVNPEMGELHLKANMKPIPCTPDINYIDYYIDDIFDHNYHRMGLHSVPVSKD